MEATKVDTYHPGDEMSPQTHAAFITARLANARWNRNGGVGMRYTVVQCLDEALIEDSASGGWLYVEELLDALDLKYEAIRLGLKFKRFQ
jgi:hypothetical protein